MASAVGGRPKAQVDAAKHAAYKADGYVDEQDRKDRSRWFWAMYEAVKDHMATSKRERNKNALPRMDLTGQVYPSLAGPDGWDDVEDPVLAYVVWRELDSAVWTETGRGPAKQLQRLIGENMGNGFVMCRTKVIRDDKLVDAVYITDDYGCIVEDYVSPGQAAIKRVQETEASNIEMLIYRQPVANGKRYAKAHTDNVRAKLDGAKAQFELALDARRNGEPEDDESEGEQSGDE
jgi:hypothetical protein